MPMGRQPDCGTCGPDTAGCAGNPASTPRFRRVSRLSNALAEARFRMDLLTLFNAPFLGQPAWLWLSFLVIVAALLAFDLGVLHRKPPHARSLLVDIGGGSTEVAIATGERPDELWSLALGSVRLTEMFDAAG